MQLTPPSRRTILLLSTPVLLLFLSFLTLSIISPTPLISHVTAGNIQADLAAGRRVITYIPYTYGWGMLLQTLEGYKRAGWKDIVIVDNSWDHHAHASIKDLFPHFPILEIIPTPVHLRFSQIQGFIDHLAISGSLPVYMWSHSDVLLLHNSTIRGEKFSTPYIKAMECLFDVPDRPGTLFFAYDWLSAVYTEASKAAPWDPNMPQYGADCDRYQRVRLAGYQIWDCEQSIGKFLHLHTVLTMDEMHKLFSSGMTLEEQVDFVEKATRDSEQYEWRTSPSSSFDSITELDIKAAEAEGLGGKQYQREKWGDEDCELGDRRPNFDLARLDEPGENKKGRGRSHI